MRSGNSVLLPHAPTDGIGAVFRSAGRTADRTGTAGHGKTIDDRDGRRAPGIACNELMMATGLACGAEHAGRRMERNVPYGARSPVTRPGYAIR
jgi:hypothetical protein